MSNIVDWHGAKVGKSYVAVRGTTTYVLVASKKYPAHWYFASWERDAHLLGSFNKPIPWPMLPEILEYFHVADGMEWAESDEPSVWASALTAETRKRFGE
jgi:hypothetical protein